MSDNGVKPGINIFRPLQGTMRVEVLVIAILLIAWLLAVVGSQVPPPSVTHLA